LHHLQQTAVVVVPAETQVALVHLVDLVAAEATTLAPLAMVDLMEITETLVPEQAEAVQVYL
jgi:hypothetical protein